jgi:NTP pyrophosphatase (non-canonical NTP hydrolase)
MEVVSELESWLVSKYYRSLESELFDEIIDTLSYIEIVRIEGGVDGF